MARYYNQRRTPAPVYAPGDKVYLDASDINTTRPSKKLSHRRLGPFVVEKRIGLNAYRLTLPLSMKRLHPVFNVVKLTPAPADPFPGRNLPPPPPPELVDGEVEYVVEQILNSRMFRRRLQYLVRWEGYGREFDSWEYSENVSNAPEKITEFHTENPAAPRRIRALAFGSIPFRPIPLPTSASSRCISEGGVIVRGTSRFRPRAEPRSNLRSKPRPGPRSEPRRSPTALTQPSSPLVPPVPVGFTPLVAPRYLPPHRRTHPGHFQPRPLFPSLATPLRSPSYLGLSSLHP
jgi:Chromo (CHRromatin Organisation MOdifier) domain